MIWIRVLGPVEAETGGAPARLGGPRQRTVLARLVAARGEAVPAERLVEDVWDGAPPAQAPASLQAYISNLRKLLEPDRPPRAPARLLVSAPPGYALRLPEDAVDAWRFERLLAEARKAPDPRALVDEALSLWRGPAFAESADSPWAQAEIARLNELRLAARELRAAAALRLGDPGAVLETERLTLDAPLLEEGWRLHALVLWRTGRQGDALATLRRGRAVLAEELGLDPSPAITDLEQAILRQDTDTFDPPAPGTPHPAEAWALREPPIVRPEEELFVGRDAELAVLRGVAREPGPRVVLVTGEAGLGKSSLLARFAAGLRRDGGLVAAGACPEDPGAPPAWAWAEALRTVAAAVPPPPEAAALLSDTPPPASAGGRFRMHRAVWDWLGEAARRHPLTIMLDDLHWADAETLALLAAVTDAPLLLVAAYRAEETGDRLTGALAVLARRAPTRMALHGLAPAAVARLVAAETTAPVDGATLAALAERTGGNPFYVRESARLLDSEGGLGTVPEGVRDVLRRRLARLPEPAVAVLRLAALAGPEPAVEPLVEAAYTDEDRVLDALDAGLAAGLLTEPAPGRIRFVHALVRDTMTADLSALRRTRMHARLAAALERRTPGDVTALAHHYARAAVPDKAVEYGVRAAALAEDRYAHETAARLLAQALAAFETIPGRTAARHVELLGTLLRAQVRAGDVAAARATRRRAIEAAAGRDDLLIAAFTAWTEPTPWQTRPYGRIDTATVAHLARLLRREDLAPADRCLLLDAYAGELSGEGDPAARAAAEEAVAIAGDLGDPRLRALTTPTLLRELPYHDTAARARLARELLAIDLPAARWAGTLNLAGADVRDGDPDTVRRLVRDAEETARRHGMPEAALVAECAVATLAHIEGRPDEAGRRYTAATEEMARLGSLHATAFLRLARATLAVSAGRLADFAGGPVIAGDADLRAAALAAAGRLDEARAAFARLEPIRPDFFVTLFASFRTMTAVALGDRAAAAGLYELLLPYRGGPPAGLESLSLALHPVDHALGGLARLLGRDAAADAHFARAAEIAGRWGAPHWAADSRAALS
ncbi:BTAD domain-containing putative transcriptional regulator [Actinomadura macrotermitis]|nr:BTAD domain-containing putative transcriptional regulator [Actinomadura macrotermitis]